MNFDMKPLERKKSVLIGTLIAFMMNVMMPFFFQYDVAMAYETLGNGAMDAEQNELLSGKILICTSDGIRWVTWEELQNGDIEPSDPTMPECPLCYLNASDIDKLSIQTSVVHVFLPQKRTVSDLETDLTIHDQFIYEVGHARAPPFLA